jgi:hypothetical protein
MRKKRLVVDLRNSVETLVYRQLSSYFCIKTKSKEKPWRFLFQLVRLTANVVLCTCMYFNRLVGMVWLCGDITTIIYLFFLLFRSFLPSSPFFLFIANIIAARRWCMVNAILIRIYVKVRVLLCDCMSLRDLRYIFIRGNNVIMCTIE